MATSDVKPKSISRAKKWSEEIENLYRFQQAGYRDEIEYKQVKQVAMVDRWPETGYVKKLQRRDNTFFYYNKERECEDKEVHKVKDHGDHGWSNTVHLVTTGKPGKSKGQASFSISPSSKKGSGQQSISHMGINYYSQRPLQGQGLHDYFRHGHVSHVSLQRLMPLVRL